MLVKTSELQATALDWVVSKCENQGEGFVWSAQFDQQFIYSPSTNWAQGGPIIEREGICVDLLLSGEWLASTRRKVDAPWVGGLTPLIAAMRCYVASKLGEEVDIPEGL